MPSPVTIRALRSATFGLGRKFSRTLANREELTIPRPTQEIMEAISTQQAAGLLEVLSATGTGQLSPVRKVVKDQLHIYIGKNNDGVILPNAGQLHKLTLGGVAFTLGDSNIDGATAADIVTALVAALAASTAFVATKATVLTSTVLSSTAAASIVLTSNDTNVTAGEAVTVGTKVYTFRANLTGAVEGDVLRGADADASLLNLSRAINHTGTPDTDYKCAAAHPMVSASATVTSHTITLTARVAGTGGNSIAVSDTSSTLTWAGSATTLASGAGPDALGLVVLDGSDVANWAAFLSSTSITDTADEAIAATALGLSTTSFSRSGVDTNDGKVRVLMQHTVTANDVTRGYLLLDTGLSSLPAMTTNPPIAVRIANSSGVTILHNGTVTVLGGRSLLIENNGNTDFFATDVVTLLAAGAD